MLKRAANNKSAQMMLIRESQRAFSVGESNVLKGQHIRYIPKKKLQFDYISPEGPLTLVFQASDAFYKRQNNWLLSTGAAIPATALAYYTLGAQFWWVYPMLYLPTLFHLYDLAQLKLIMFKTEIYKMWLY